MAETLISPGVLARENDQSQITSQPVQAGAAIVGPTVLGKKGVPKLVTSFSEYLANFGSTFTSGSDTYTYFTSVSAYNYFNNGGTSLLVDRVNSGSFSTADSTLIPALEAESGALVVGRNISGSYLSGGVGGTAGTYTGVATTNSGAGDNALTLTITTGVAAGKILASTVLANSAGGINAATSVGTFSDVSQTSSSGGGTGLSADIITATGTTFTTAAALTPTPTITANAAGTTAALATVSSGTGTGATILVTSDGVNITGAVIDNVGTGGAYVAGETITVTKVLMDADGSIGTTGADLVITIAQLNLTSTLTSITVNDAGVGYANLDTITFAAANIGSPSSDLVVTVATADLSVELEDAIVVAAGTGYIIGDDVTVALALIGSPSADLVFDLVADDIVNTNVFTLETISEGTVMNSDGTQNANGAISNGTRNNIRWEIQAPNSGSGTFSLIIRQGNDNSKSKSILEIFPNVSLDPKQSNYVARIVGDMTEVLLGAGTADPYIQSQGSYRNGSRYVRVKSVNLKTPDYFNNDGIAKDEYTGSIPMASSGAFSGASGNIVAPNQNYYDKINNNDSQGVDASSVPDYTDAFNLLANKDDYRYNILSSPGLVYANSNHKTVLNVGVQNVQGRGDAIFILDLENYGSTVSAATGTAASIDNSYAAAYWPWLQLSDPDSAQLVWVPASTLMPGVYAYNDKSAEAWFAPAGINRGGLSTVVQAERKLTQTNRDDLYTGKVNPIATFPGRGVVVFGQKTLQSQASALDRVNVRRLLIELKSYISQIADNLVFEQNTAATRNGFLAQVNPYLESVQQRQGLYAFKVVMDASNNGPEVVDRNQMVGAIYLQPTKTAEFIYLDFNILPTGAQFPS
jgi:uncharacterized protein